MEQTTIDKNKVIDDLLLLVATKNKKYDTLKKSHTNLRIAADEGLHECERVKMHCTCNKDLGGLFARIERIEQAISDSEKV